MITLNNQKLLTKKQAEVLARHVRGDIAFAGGGTFHHPKCDCGDEHKFDAQDAKIAEEALRRIEQYLTQD